MPRTNGRKQNIANRSKMQDKGLFEKPHTLNLSIYRLNVPAKSKYTAQVFGFTETGGED